MVEKGKHSFRIIIIKLFIIILAFITIDSKSYSKKEKDNKDNYIEKEL